MPVSEVSIFWYRYRSSLPGDLARLRAGNVTKGSSSITCTETSQPVSLASTLEANEARKPTKPVERANSHHIIAIKAGQPGNWFTNNEMYMQNCQRNVSQPVRQACSLHHLSQYLLLSQYNSSAKPTLACSLLYNQALCQTRSSYIEPAALLLVKKLVACIRNGCHILKKDNQWSCPLVVYWRYISSNQMRPSSYTVKINLIKLIEG